VVRILEAAQKSLELDGLPISLKTGVPHKRNKMPRMDRQWTPQLPSLPVQVPAVALS